MRHEPLRRIACGLLHQTIEHVVVVERRLDGAPHPVGAGADEREDGIADRKPPPRRAETLRRPSRRWARRSRARTGAHP